MGWDREEGTSHVPSWLSYQPVLITDPGHLFSSWKECHHLIIAGEATETWTNPVALPHYAIGGVGVGLPEGKSLVIGIFQGYFKH